MRQTQELAEFLANLHLEHVPEAVVDRCEDLFLDWVASVLAAKGLHPTPLFEALASNFGPSEGPSRILSTQSSTSAYFAALVNGAAGHLVEQDDLHNSSVFHPASVVFPAVLAAAQDLQATGKAFLLASIAGYEAGIRIAEFLGRSHYKVFHTTATVGTLAAAVGVGKLMRFDSTQFLNLLGSAATQSAGLWEFLSDAADSKQLHTAKAAADGVLAAYLTQQGLTGAKNVLQGKQGLGAGMSTDTNDDCLNDQLGSRWALAETSFKFHASCRHTHPAADALVSVMAEHQLQHNDIKEVITHVHQAALDVLGRVSTPQTVHQAKFSMGTVLGLLAVHGAAGLEEFDKYALSDPNVIAFNQRVTMQYSEEVDSNYPKKWLGRISVITHDGTVLKGQIDEPKGDPGNTLSREELKQKFERLLHFSGARDASELQRLSDLIWNLRSQEHVNNIN